MIDERRASDAITIAVVESHQLYADALALLLALDARFVVQFAGTLATAPAADTDLHTALVAIDDPRGIELAIALTHPDRAVRVVGLHSGAGPDLAEQAFDVGVRALARRDEGLTSIVEAVIGSLNASPLGASNPHAGIELSGRELAVLDSIASGRTAEEIARRLHLTSGETAAAKRRAVHKLGARTQAEAVAQARRLGILGSDQREIE